MRTRRRGRGFLAVVALSGATLAVWDHTGSLPFLGLADRKTAVAGASYEAGPGASAQLAAGWENHADRRDQVLAAAPTGAPGAGAPPSAEIVAGDAAIAPAPAEFEAPADPPPPPPAALRTNQFEHVKPEGGTWAVMIGINDYPGTKYDLNSAVNDATDVDEALARLGVPGNHRLLLRNSQASAGTIRSAVDWLNAHAGPDAVAVFFYAGHVRKIDGDTEAIVGADGGVVTDAELAAQLEGLTARQAWIALAACYSGGFDEVMKPGRVLTAAAGRHDLAFENDAFGRSYLVEYMVRRAMIQGRAPSSVEAAFAWARAELERDFPNRVPLQFDQDAAELDLRPGGPYSRQQHAATSSPTTTQPPPPSGGGSGNGGGEDPQDSPPDDDGCARLTIGVVRCGGDDG